MQPDTAWVAEIIRACDPMFQAADVGFVHQVMYDAQEPTVVTALLWEADPQKFASRYPDSGIEEEYGDGWPDTPCIDYWVEIDASAGLCRLKFEGWNLPELLLELSGRGVRDGAALADTVARILGVRSPRV